MRPLIILRGSALILFVMLTTSCSDHSKAFNELSRMDVNLRVKAASNLPVHERLEVYEEFFTSHHPPDTDLSSAFRNDAQKSFALILQEMKIGGQGRALSYLPIIVDLQESASLNICQSENIRKIQSVLQEKRYDDEQKEAIRTWKVGTCNINL
jgi:hypothetical protein